MKLVGAVILGLSVLFNLVFVIKFGRPGRHPDRSVARYLASTAWQQLALDSSLLAMLLGLDLSPWVALAALAFGDITAAWRLYLTFRGEGARHVDG